MVKTTDMHFPKTTFAGRLGSMLRVDSRRMFLTPLFFIMLGIAIVVPILILVMTTMMDGSVSVNPQTGEETVMEGFDFVWQIIGSVSAPASAPSDGGAMSMDLVSMCNINLWYFGIAVLICLFVAEDFRSGYVKNLFAVRAKKSDYILSKTLICFAASALLLFGFFLGALVGGAIAGLPFIMEGFHAGNLAMCMLSKVFLMAAFVAIYVMAAVIAKHRTWLGMVISMAVAMLLFAMIPMITPLNATGMHVLLTLVGGTLFSIGLGSVSRLILKKKDILT